MFNFFANICPQHSCSALLPGVSLPFQFLEIDAGIWWGPWSEQGAAVAEWPSNTSVVVQIELTLPSTVVVPLTSGNWKGRSGSPRSIPSLVHIPSTFIPLLRPKSNRFDAFIARRNPLVIKYFRKHIFSDVGDNSQKTSWLVAAERNSFNNPDYRRESSTTTIFLVLLKRANVPAHDIICFYRTCIRPVLEYCALLYHHALPDYLSKDI